MTKTSAPCVLLLGLLPPTLPAFDRHINQVELVVTAIDESDEAFRSDIRWITGILRAASEEAQQWYNAEIVAEQIRHCTLLFDAIENSRQDFDFTFAGNRANLFDLLAIQSQDYLPE